MTHPHQTGDELARANGFRTFRALLASSRHIPAHGPEQFLATTRDGHRFLWGEDDVRELAARERRGIRMSRGSWSSRHNYRS